MSTAEQKKKLLTLCNSIRENDRSVTVLDLSSGTAGRIAWSDAHVLSQALDRNTRVVEANFNIGQDGMAPPGAVLFTHFLRTSPRLRTFVLSGAGTPNHDHGATPILINAISYSKSLVSLNLCGNFSDEPQVLEKLIANTKTLKRLEFSGRGHRQSSLKVAQSLRRGFIENQTLETLVWRDWEGAHLDEALVGLFDLPKLKTLEIHCPLTQTSCQVLRCFLKCSESLEVLRVNHLVSSAILQGVAENRSLKLVQIYTESLSDCDPLALTEMFHRNKTMQTFELKKLSHPRVVLDREWANAFAHGLRDNTSVKNLILEVTLSPDTLHGPSWQEMIESNASLVSLQLAKCFVDSFQGDFLQKFTLGLSRNRCLKHLSLAGNKISVAHAAELAEALSSNETLETLELSTNIIQHSEGAAILAKFWSNKTLKRLKLSNNRLGVAGDHATVFSDGLPNNDTLELLLLRQCALSSSDCRVILDSLRESKVLKELHLGGNNISLGGSCATALTELLEHSRIQKLALNTNAVTYEGMSELASGLNLNNTLTGLELSSCELGTEGLIVLAEALVTNKTLETLNLCDNAFDKDGLCGFFDLLPKMKGLKDLHFNASLLDERVGLKLKEGLKGNKTLQAIGSVSQSDLASEIKDSIEFYLKMNRNGRRFLQESKDEDAVPLPFGAWPRILAKMTSPSERDELFHFLRHKGDLVHCPPPSRKRKASDVVVSSD